VSFLEIFSLALGAILINNFIFSRFMGCCPFLGVSKKTDTAVGMGLAVVFVITLASAVTYVLNTYVLVPLHLEYMQTSFSPGLWAAARFWAYPKRPIPR